MLRWGALAASAVIVLAQALVAVDVDYDDDVADVDGADGTGVALLEVAGASGSAASWSVVLSPLPLLSLVVRRWAAARCASALRWSRVHDLKCYRYCCSRLCYGHYRYRSLYFRLVAADTRPRVPWR